MRKGTHPREFVFHRNHSLLLVISGIQTHWVKLCSALAPMMDSLSISAPNSSIYRSNGFNVIHPCLLVFSISTPDIQHRSTLSHLKINHHHPLCKWLVKMYLSEQIFGLSMDIMPISEQILPLYTGLLTMNTVETLYNTINFCWSTHERHSIARPKGRGMGCLLWVQRATYCVDLSIWSSIKYLLE